MPRRCEKSARPPLLSSALVEKGARISSRGTFCGGRLSDHPQKRIFPPRGCAASPVRREGSVPCERKRDRRKWVEVGLCNVCDYVGNYPRRLRSRRPPLPSAPSASPRRRKGCNSLLARNGSDGGGVITAPEVDSPTMINARVCRSDRGPDLSFLFFSLSLFLFPSHLLRFCLFATISITTPLAPLHILPRSSLASRLVILISDLRNSKSNRPAYPFPVLASFSAETFF